MMGETFIGEFARWVARFFPRLQICQSTYGGVKWKRGKKIREIKPGLFWYWPLVTKFQLIPVKHHSVDLPDQSLTTRCMESEDDVTIGVSTVIVITITDVVKALTETHDIDGLITELGGAATAKAITKRTFSECLDNLVTGVWNDIEIDARRLLKKYGVNVEYAYTNDFAQSRNFRHMGVAGPVVDDEEE